MTQTLKISQFENQTELSECLKLMVNDNQDTICDSVQILMVDDDIDDIYTTKRRLKESNITNGFTHESDPRRLFETLDEIRADGNYNPNVIILLDINMPNLDGIEVLRELRRNTKYKNLPIIMLCNSEDIVDMLDSYEDGADGYLVKPIQAEEMLAFIDLKSTHGLQLVQ